jgi:hypothetical protein
MNKFICEFCKKEFSYKHNLSNHQKTAKYCLILRNDHQVINFNCNYCNKNFTSKQRLDSHIEVCDILKFDLKIKEKDNLLSQKDILIEELRTQLKILQEKNHNLTLHAIDKPSFIQHQQFKNTDNSQHNTLNNIQAINLEKERISDAFKKLTFEDVTGGQEALAKYVYKNIICDENGLPQAICTDKSRQVIKYKNKNNQVVKDPKGYNIVHSIMEDANSAALRIKDEYINKHYTENKDESYEEIDFIDSDCDEIDFYIFSDIEYYQNNHKIVIEPNLENKLKIILADHLNLQLNQKFKLKFRSDERTFEFYNKLERLKNKYINDDPIYIKEEIAEDEDGDDFLDYNRWLIKIDKEYDLFIKKYQDKQEDKLKLDLENLKKSKEERQSKAEEIIKDIEKTKWTQEKKDYYLNLLIEGIKDYQLLRLNLCKFSRRLSALLPSDN